MFTTQFGVLWMILLCCYNNSEAKLLIKNRISVALAGKTVEHHLEVIIPVNSTKSTIKCYRNSTKIWEYSVDGNTSPTENRVKLSANITMHNSSDSGEYYFEHKNEKLYWVVLVRDVGYLPETESPSLLLPVIIGILLLFSVLGSIYIFKLYKNHSRSEEDDIKVKAKLRKRNKVATEEGATSDSVYTALQHTTVSVYDVLTVDEARGESIESQTSKKKAKPSPVEEGIFESVYENL